MRHRQHADWQTDDTRRAGRYEVVQPFDERTHLRRRRTRVGRNREAEIESPFRGDVRIGRTGEQARDLAEPIRHEI